jgi:hypothetical protein
MITSTIFGTIVKADWGRIVRGKKQAIAVFAGPEGTIYALRPDGNLLWYRHHGLDSGVFLWSGPKWKQEKLSGLTLVV